MSVLAATALLVSAAWAAGRDYPIQPVPFTAVRVRDEFWQPRMETNRAVTVWYDLKKCEETGRIDNFAKAAGLMKGEFRGIPFDDSDVYKVIEGAAYSLALQPDPKLDKYLDEIIAKIAAAQEPDGYLYTARRLFPAEKMPAMSGRERWSNLASSHELYNVGHLYEAAVAHFLATGKRSLLDVALRNADFICQTFGPGADQRKDPPGHQEIEMGLVKLYRVTAERKYLDQAKFFLDQRGRPEGHKLRGAGQQDHKPVVEQDEAVGHSVRACYMYSGMADVAALTGDAAYLRAIDRLWENVVGKKLYLTGGVGARPKGEAFGDAHELPNSTAYTETCAAIANALWNHRMFLLHGHAQYLDVLERIIYNGFLAGVALSGDQFFYPNPLEADGKRRFNHGGATRQPWFGCACCPVNVVRFIPSLAG
ncbi:MAG: glycoside hydrolase family 127 protein, partial [Planctomycetes bacterium]|nr:glycoside hydrolase family 127 protein [Planctomycetota bacterium]